MERFFELNNNAAIKFNEIQMRFVDGIGCLLERHGSDPYSVTVGLKKLWRMKGLYEQQLMMEPNAKDITVCFRCFDKPDGDCTDCD